MADKVIYWSKTALTGGAAGALDSIDGTALQDGEVAHVWISNVLYIYLLDVDSAAAESSPAIIAPDTNAGDKRWILQSYYSGSGTLYTDHIAESTSGHGVEIDGLTIKDSGFALGSDADGDMYYRASGALARLAKGAAGAMLGVNDAGTAPEYKTLKATAAGIVTNASQPAFLVMPASNQENIAIDSDVTVVWGTEVFDQGSNFASNAFTAPVAGKYQLNVIINFDDVDSAAATVISIKTNNRNYGVDLAGAHISADSDNVGIAISALANMSAGHTASVIVHQYGGTQQLDVKTTSSFSGFLVC